VWGVVSEPAVIDSSSVESFQSGPLPTPPLLATTTDSQVAEITQPVFESHLRAVGRGILRPLVEFGRRGAIAICAAADRF
jgi:hypothetical protein